MTDVTPAKQALRRSMRAARRQAATPERSARISEALISLVDRMQVTTVMVFDAVPGEPDLAPFVAWCAANGVITIAPVADRAAERPVNPSDVDVVVVPGLAFTRSGHRLGQGGGWYDGFLADTRPDCRTIGVGFSEQIVDQVPVEPHDVVLDVVVTEHGVLDHPHHPPNA